MLPSDAPLSTRKPTDTPLIGSAHFDANTSNNVSPPNEYLGATASRLKVEIKEPNSDVDKNRGSNMSNKNDTLHRLDHKFVPQYQNR